MAKSVHIVIFLHFGTPLDSFRGTSDEIGTMQKE